MSNEKDRLLDMLKKQKITQDDYKILLAALDKQPSKIDSLFSFAMNPFRKIAGLYSLAIGLIIIVCTSYLGLIANTYTTGLMGILNASAIKNPKISINFFLLLYQNTIVCLVLSVLYIIVAKVYKQKRLRVIDFFGTVTLSRFPFLVITFVLSMIQLISPTFMNIDFSKEGQFQPSFSMSALLFILLIGIIWQIVMYFNALKESSGLTGKNLWISFVIALVAGEVISSALTNLVL